LLTGSFPFARQIAQDHSATSLLGPLATPSQHSNADLASSLYHLWSPLNRALPEHSESVKTVLRPSVDVSDSSFKLKAETQRAN